MQEKIKHLLGEAMRSAIKQSGKTQKDVAETLEISENGLINYLKGKRVPDAILLNELAELCGISIQEFFSWGKRAASAAGMTSVPVMAYAGAGDAYTEEIPLDDDKRVTVPKLQNSNGRKVWALRVKGASMEPFINDGDYLIVALTEFDQLKNGKDYVFVIDEGLVVKKAILEEGKWLVLRSNNKKFKDRTNERPFRVFEILYHMHEFRPLLVESS